MMKKIWLLLTVSLFLVAPALFGCSSQASQGSADQQIEREDAEAPEEDENEDDADEAENE